MVRISVIRRDGLTWSCNEFETDGTHPAQAAESKVGQRLLQFFLTSPYTMPWFHIMLGSRCSWLHGDARGFRDRKHRLHSTGDYKNPPPSKEHADVRLQLQADLAELYESGNDFDKAAAALGEVSAILDRPEALLEEGPFSREEITAQAADSCERQGKLWVKAGKFAEAVAAFRKAQARDPNRGPRLFFNLAEVLTCGERRIRDHPGLAARRQDHLHVRIVAMLRDAAPEPERVVVGMREHEREPTGAHSPSNGSRPTVRPPRLGYCLCRLYRTKLEVANTGSCLLSTSCTRKAVVVLGKALICAFGKRRRVT